MAKFEIVSKFADQDLVIPQRATARAAGYDLAAAEDIIIKPMDKLMIDLMEEADRSAMAPLNYSLNQMASITKSSKAKPTLVSTGLKAKLANEE